MPDTNPFHANDPVEKVLQIFREAWFAGNQPDPDSFCADHPDSGIELRNRIENFLMAARMLPAMGASRDGSAPQILREPALKSGRFLGDFRILSEIGRGGMGVVYEAQQVSLNRKVALKVLPEHLSFSEQAIKKFQREAEAGGRQQHPGIVAVYAQGEHEGVHYIAHELIEGGRNLADQLAELRKKPRLPRDHFRYSASFIAEVAEALTHAHRSGVIHRDVKPSNILLDSEGQPKVTDFGLARIEDALSLSRSGDFAGTPFYMSPEQASGRNSGIDHRTDIYSLGVTLYEMLTLQRPFDGETSQDVLKKIIFHEPRNPCRINPRVPRDLAVICLKAMEKQPDHRYASMYDFADDLHRFLAGETILARPVGLFMQCAKCIRRNPVWSAALGVTALALLVGLVALIDSRNEAQRAEELSRKADAQRFLIEASDSFTANPGYGALLAYEGAKISGGLQANNMLLQALRACHEQREYTFSPGSRPVAVSPLGDRALVLTDEREAWIFGLPDEDRLCRLEELHGDLYSPEFSPDGCQIAVVEYDEEADALARHTVSLFDAKTGKKTQTLFGHTSLIHKAAFNRTSDKLITASWDMTARVWNLATGDCETTLKGHGWHATCAAFHSKGDRAITGSEDAVVRLWDLSTAKELTSFTGHEGEIRSVAFSPNDRMILSTSADRTFRIWDVESGKKLASIPDHAQALTGASFSREGNKVVTAAEDGSVMVWELAELFSYSRIESAIGNSSNGDDGEERVKEFHSFARISPVALRGHDRAVFRVLFDPRNSHVLTLSEDRTLRTWNAEAGLGCSEILEEAPCTGFSISGEGNKLAWVSMDRTRVRLWDLIEGRLLHDLDIQEGWLDNLDWTSYWAYENGSLNQERVGKAEWAARKPEILIDENDCRIRRVKLNARGTLLAVDFMGNIMQIRDLASGKEVKTFRYHGDIRSLCFSEDGKSILLAQGARCVQIFGLHDLSDHCFTDISEAFDLICARFDSTGKRILTVSLNGQACLWDRSLTQPLAVLCGEADSGQGKVLDVDWARFTPDEQQIVTRHMDGCLRLWDVRSGGKVFSEIPNAEGDEFRPVIDGSGSRILARTSTGEIAVHDLSGNRRRVLLRSRETFEEGSACFSPDSRFVAALTRNQAVRLYDASTGDLWISTNHESPILAMGFSKDSGNVISVFENGCVSTWPADPMKAAETYLPIKMPLDEWDAMRKARKRERGHENAVESDPSRSGIEKRVRDLAGIGINGSASFSNPVKIPLDPSNIEPVFYIAKERQPNGKSWIAKHIPGQVREDERVFPFQGICVLTLALSPEGGRLCFMTHEGESGRVSIHMLDLDTCTERCICTTDRDSPSEPAWHPAGQGIFFSMGEDAAGGSGTGIYFINADGPADQKPVKVLGRPGHKFLQPSFSPDGSRICFTYEGDSNNAHDREIWIAECSKSGDAVWNPVRLTSRYGRDEYGVFLSNTRICWVSSVPDDNLRSLQCVDLSENKVACLYQGFLVGPPAVSLSGFLAFHCCPVGDQNLIQFLNASGAPVHSISQEKYALYHPVFPSR